MSTGFDDVYRTRASFYGDQPSPNLVLYLQKYSVPGKGAGFDLGCGQGRNTLYLARQGFSMLGVDSSAEAIARLAEQADMQKLDAVGQVADMAQVAIEPNHYQLIVANTSLDHLPPAQGERLAQAMIAGLAPGGYLFVSVFMVNDPGCSAQGKASETAAYVQHYYQPEELRQQFAALTLLAYQEEYALDVGHGEPHYHGIARLFARRDAPAH